MPVAQKFKSIYIPDGARQHNLTLAFGPKDSDIFDQIKTFSSSEFRDFIGVHSLSELKNKSEQEGLALNTYCRWLLRKNLETRLKVARSKKTQDISKYVNRVIEGDCLSVMPNFPAKSIDMILCDLPYGTTQNSWDSVIPLEELWDNYMNIIKDDGVIVLTGQGLFTAQLMLSNQRYFKYKITWVKSKPTNFLNAKKQPLRKHEDICVFYKSQPRYFPQMSEGVPYNKGFRKDQLTGSYGEFRAVEVKSDGQRYPSDVIYFKTAESEGRVYHPTQKPVELGRYLIRTFTQPGDIVLDNASGSGSFLVAAVLENRQFIGIEKNEETIQFKKDEVDLIKVSRDRIRNAAKSLFS